MVELLLRLGAPPDHAGNIRSGCLQVTPLMLAAGARPLYNCLPVRRASLRTVTLHRGDAAMTVQRQATLLWCSAYGLQAPVPSA